MTGGLDLLPSLVVFGSAAVLVAAGVVGFRRLGVRRERLDATAARELETRAKVRLVRADDAVRDAQREVRFVEAQFGAEAARELGGAVERAAGWLREAFVLQQRLDDAEAHTAAERRTWSARIEGLCDSIEGVLGAAAADLSARRAAERGAVDDAPALRDRAAALARRRAEADAALARLADRFTPAALAEAHRGADRAGRELAAASAALDEADARLARAAGEPARELLSSAAGHLERAAGDLGEVEGVEGALAAAQREAAAEAAGLDEELAAARRERDAHADPDEAAALGAAIGEASVTLGARGELSGDPVTDRDRLRATRDRLEVARAAARASQQRLDGARGALAGALAIAESQLVVARAAVDRGGRRVGADARTRLAEAERQLVMARQEPDPVAALDAARRSAARANDAEALAHYDTLGGAY
jgi:hypothetical protein